MNKLSQAASYRHLARTHMCSVVVISIETLRVIKRKQNKTPTFSRFKYDECFQLCDSEVCEVSFVVGDASVIANSMSAFAGSGVIVIPTKLFANAISSSLAVNDVQRM